MGYIKRGFTLIELLVTIAIIGLLASIVLVALDLPGRKAAARLVKALEFSQSMQNAIGDELVGAWTFENVAGGKTPDMSGYGNEGTIYGATQVDGLKLASGAGTGKGLSFDGVNDYVDAGTNSSLRPANAITMSSWVKVSSLPSLNNRIAGIFRLETVYYGYVMRLVGDSYTIVGQINIAGTPRTITIGTVTQNIWAYIALTFDGTTLTPYFNGVKGTSVNYSGAITYPPTTTNFYIGSYLGTSYYFNGLIDDIRIYGKALTLGEIQKQYAAGVERHNNLAALK